MIDTPAPEPKARGRYVPIALAALLLGFVGGYSFPWWRVNNGERIQMSFAGADITRSGGKIIDLTSGDVTYRQSCAGACDDVRLEYPVSGAPTFDMRITGAGEACVLCSGVGYIDTYGSDLNVYHIRGEQELRLVDESLGERPQPEPRVE